MTGSPDPVRRPLRPVGVRGPWEDELAVSDVLGSILLVGITVVSAVGLGLLILSFDGPPETQHSRLVASMAPGLGGWNTGDEQLRLAHLGGEPLDGDGVRIIYTPPSGTPVMLSGSSLGSAFADGELTIGETWVIPLTAALNDLFDIKVVVTGGRTQLVADARIVAGSSGNGVLCLGDDEPPTASFNAPDVTSRSTGAVTVSVTLADNCAGVDENVVPHLFWCVAVSCTVPSSYTDAGAMTDIGTRQWSGLVPSHDWLAKGLAGASLRYYTTAMTDNNGNAAQSAVQVDLIDLLLTYTYVGSAAPTTGTVTNLANAQSAADGVEADIAEGPLAGSGAPVGPTKYSGTTVVDLSATNEGNVLTSDNVRASMDATGEYIELSGFDLPPAASAVTAIEIGYEGRKSSAGGTSPTSRLDYKIGAGAYNTGVSITEGATADTDRTRLLTGTFSVADVETMTVRVFTVNGGSRVFEVDHMFVTVTYTSATTVYATDVRLDWSGIPSGVAHSVELQYRVTGDTFNVQVWNFLTSTWRTCTGTLTAATLSSYSCSLTPSSETSSGAARVRIRDAAPTGATQGHLYLDHARVGTA